MLSTTELTRLRIAVARETLKTLTRRILRKRAHVTVQWRKLGMLERTAVATLISEGANITRSHNVAIGAWRDTRDYTRFAEWIGENIGHVKTVHFNDDLYLVLVPDHNGNSFMQRVSDAPRIMPLDTPITFWR